MRASVCNLTAKVARTLNYAICNMRKVEKFDFLGKKED
jgi:hypothetical protein